MRNLVLLTAMLTFSVTAVQAQSNISAGAAFQGCKDGAAVGEQALVLMYNVGLCNGLVWGIIYAMPNVCLPPGVTDRQNMAIVMRHIEERPGHWHRPFREVAYDALMRAWACR